MKTLKSVHKFYRITSYTVEMWGETKKFSACYYAFISKHVIALFDNQEQLEPRNLGPVSMIIFLMLSGRIMILMMISRKPLLVSQRDKLFQLILLMIQNQQVNCFQKGR